MVSYRVSYIISIYYHIYLNIKKINIFKFIKKNIYLKKQK